MTFLDIHNEVGGGSVAIDEAKDFVFGSDSDGFVVELKPSVGCDEAQMSVKDKQSWNSVLVSNARFAGRSR